MYLHLQLIDNLVLLGLNDIIKLYSGYTYKIIIDNNDNGNLEFEHYTFTKFSNNQSKLRYQYCYTNDFSSCLYSNGKTMNYITGIITYHNPSIYAGHRWWYRGLRYVN